MGELEIGGFRTLNCLVLAASGPRLDIGYDGSFSSRVQNNAIRAAMDLKL
jgi:hypothetical protein